MKRELIHDYIECFGTDEMMEKFKEMKKESASFGSMKSWFLGQFPTFGNVEKAKKEIQKYRLDMFKEKYKVTVRTASKNSKPSSDASVQ